MKCGGAKLPVLNKDRGAAKRYCSALSICLGFFCARYSLLLQNYTGFFITGLMMKILRLVIMIIGMLITLLKAAPSPAEFTSIPHPSLTYPQFQYANAQLWEYARRGLNYLESPQPLAPPEAVPPTYRHPDARGFGAYGFSPEAYYDVQRLYPFFRIYSWHDVLHSPQLYELANQAFADWLLKNLQNDIPARATKEQIFDALHKAWNLGLSGFKNGKTVVASRMRRTEEFKQIY